MENLDGPQSVSWLDFITKECPEDNAHSDSGTLSLIIFLISISYDSVVIYLNIYYLNILLLKQIKYTYSVHTDCLRISLLFLA